MQKNAHWLIYSMTMKTKCKKTELGHGGQILTTRKTIIHMIWDIEYSVVENTIYSIASALSGKRDDWRLYTVCDRLYYLSKLVYRGKDGICKLSPVDYQQRLFEPRAETVEEVARIMERIVREDKECPFEFSDELAETVFRCLTHIELLWCYGIACFYEQIYVPELAYALDYVVSRNGNLPMPEFQCEYSPFPTNYKDYNYTEGIAEYFEEKMVSIF